MGGLSSYVVVGCHKINADVVLTTPVYVVADPTCVWIAAGESADAFAAVEELVCHADEWVIAMLLAWIFGNIKHISIDFVAA